MFNSRILRLLRSLDNLSFKYFVQYVRSPYFNRNPRLVILVEILQESYPDFEGSSLSKESLFEAMYGKDEPYNEQKVYDHFSFLNRLLENFLAQQQYEADPNANHLYLLGALAERKAYGSFERHYQKTLENHLRDNQGDSKTYLDAYRLSLLGDVYFGIKGKRVYDENLEKGIRNLDIFYLSSRLRHSCELLNRHNIINADYSAVMIPEITSFLERADNTYREVPVIAIYYQIYLTLTEPENEAHFAGLVRLLQLHGGGFPRSEAAAMYTYALNYCTKKINSGHQNYLSELFGLYKQLLTEDILLEEGVISHQYVKNITTLGLRLKAYDWVREFLDTYKSRLAPEVRDNVYNYNLAVYHYERRQFNEALQLLQTVEFSDVYYQLSAKSILLKIFYEQKEEDALESLLLSFRVYLNRNKNISRYQHKVHYNLLRFTRQLYQLRLKQSLMDKHLFNQKVVGLRSKVASTQEIANLNWLNKKIDELNSGPPEGDPKGLSTV